MAEEVLYKYNCNDRLIDWQKKCYTSIIVTTGSFTELCQRGLGSFHTQTHLFRQKYRSLLTPAAVGWSRGHVANHSLSYTAAGRAAAEEEDNFPSPVGWD